MTSEGKVGNLDKCKQTLHHPTLPTCTWAKNTERMGVNTDGTKTSYKDDHTTVETFPASYGTLRSITVFTRAPEIRGLDNIS
jgi:hypothetical protein